MASYSLQRLGHWQDMPTDSEKCLLIGGTGSRRYALRTERMTRSGHALFTTRTEYRSEAAGHQSPSSIQQIAAWQRSWFVALSL